MATLHFVAGMAGAGKTTLARHIAQTAPAALICEDEWLLRLAPPIENVRQYAAQTDKIRSIIGPLSVDLLRLGTSVVLDFAGNTVRDRRWVRSLFERANADHRLHYLVADAAICRQRVRLRNLTKPDGVFFGVVTDEQLDEVNRYFTPPGADEGFTVIVHDERPERQPDVRRST